MQVLMRYFVETQYQMEDQFGESQTSWRTSVPCHRRAGELDQLSLFIDRLQKWRLFSTLAGRSMTLSKTLAYSVVKLNGEHFCQIHQTSVTKSSGRFQHFYHYKRPKLTLIASRYSTKIFYEFVSLPKTICVYNYVKYVRFQGISQSKL